MAESEEIHDLSRLLSSNERDFLIRNYKQQIPVSSLVGKTVGLYFCGALSHSCKVFTDKLEEGLPKLFILDPNGKVTTSEGVRIVMEYGEHAFPFTSDHIRILEETEAEKWQCLNNIFGPDDLLITKENTQSGWEHRGVALCRIIALRMPVVYPDIDEVLP
ncbi:hypothetical protein FNV43_RR25997 [Rhamnella rubrinervis]|uniref:Uncharacterized protein n=1 Tax=Rhamnella rubrinervis TaxID=2594499 RepID=A0A8K0DHT7_9ROSA|nr:hypothetical protein FNV43_RR25997 [Rhamnella rubrinervis]